jgi:two-component system, response regulator, stage 0 sporulation protein F
MAQNGLDHQALVMVVDDDDEARELLAQILQDEGYEVVQAENGQRAVELALRVSPRLILLDLNMPVMDGWEFLRWLGRQSGIKSTVIVITAQIPGVIPDASAVVRKPLDVPYLLDLMNQLWAKRPL